MTLIDQLDVAAKKTGIPQAATGQPRRRPMRWLPMLALLIGFGGWLAVLIRPGFPIPGLMVVVLVTCFAVWIPMLGPLKGIGSTEATDEFDRAASMRSYLVALGATAFFALIALLLLAGLTLLLGWTREMLIESMIATAMMMLVIWSALPTLHASWSIRPLDEDD